METICSACFPFKKSFALMEENASFNSCNALSFHGLSSMPCSGVSTCQCSFHFVFFHFYSFQRLRILEDILKCLCSFPPRTSFSTVVQQTCSFFIIVKKLLHYSNLSAFTLFLFLSLFFLFASTKWPFRPTKENTYHSSNLSTSCTQTCPPLSEGLSCLFLFIRSSFLQFSVVIFLDNPPRLFTSAFVPSFLLSFTSTTFPTLFFHFFTQPTDHKPWLTANPPTTLAVACRARKVCRGSKSVRLCFFPDEAGVRECPSQDRHRRARTLPTDLPGPDDTSLLHLRSIPHAGDRTRRRLWEVVVPSGFHSWMTTVTPLRHD